MGARPYRADLTEKNMEELYPHVLPKTLVPQSFEHPCFDKTQVRNYPIETNAQELYLKVLPVTPAPPVCEHWCFDKTWIQNYPAKKPARSVTTTAGSPCYSDCTDANTTLLRPNILPKFRALQPNEALDLCESTTQDPLTERPASVILLYPHTLLQLRSLQPNEALDLHEAKRRLPLAEKLVSRNTAPSGSPHYSNGNQTNTTDIRLHILPKFRALQLNEAQD
eukprot:s808_g13.t1